MSEKRFEIRTNINGEHWLFDNKYDKAMMISKIRATLLDVCNMLNEQQATIDSLKEENEKIIENKCTDCELVSLQTRKIDTLTNENEQLRFQLEECSNNKLFSRRELERENEQLKNRLNKEYIKEYSIK